MDTKLAHMCVYTHKTLISDVQDSERSKSTYNLVLVNVVRCRSYLVEDELTARRDQRQLKKDVTVVRRMASKEVAGCLRTPQRVSASCYLEEFALTCVLVQVCDKDNMQRKACLCATEAHIQMHSRELLGGIQSCLRTVLTEART